jgi:hypothetical protein
MTAVELQIEFNRLFEQVYRMPDSERLNPYDTEGLLNKAQDQMLYDKFLSYNTPYENVVALNRSYDEISELITVHTGATLTTAESGYGDNAKKIESLPSDYLYYVRSSSKIDRVTLKPVTDEWTGNNIIGLDSLIKTISGAGNYPIIIHPLVYLAGQNIYVIYDGFTTVKDFNLMYLKQPQQLDLSADNECELPGHWHYDLADYAIRLHLGQRKVEAKKESDERS